MALGKADENKTTTYNILFNFLFAQKMSQNTKSKASTLKDLLKDKRRLLQTTMGLTPLQMITKKAGYKVDDGGTRTDLNMNKLLKGRVSVFAAMTEEVDFYLERPEYKGKIIKINSSSC
jgi:hypothetical protein